MQDQGQHYKEFWQLVEQLIGTTNIVVKNLRVELVWEDEEQGQEMRLENVVDQIQINSSKLETQQQSK